MQRLHDLWRRVRLRLGRRHRDARSFEHDMKTAGGLAGRADAGIQTVSVHQIVGSVSRWQNLRSDFFYKTGEVTARFIRVGEAIRAGKALPPLELYKIRRRAAGEQPPAQMSEYYVVDGHHRVAMARQLGQDYLDAHVVEYRLAPPAAATTPLSDPPAAASQAGDVPGAPTASTPESGDDAEHDASRSAEKPA